MRLHLLLPALLIAAVAGQAVARRLRLPGVVGEILAGVVLGPYLLGVIPAEGAGAPGQAAVRELAQVGLCVLLFRVGLETRLDQFRQVVAPASRLAVAGMAIPFLAGWGVTSIAGAHPPSAILIGAALTATSIGVTVSVLAELGAETSPEGAVIAGAAILDDVLGLVLLAALTGLAARGPSPLWASGKAVLQALGFLAAAMALGKPAAASTLTLVRWSRSPTTLLVLVFAYLLLLAYAARAAGLGMILGAYAAGLAFARHPERDWIQAQLAPLVNLLAPLFFVLIGASIQLGGLAPLTPAGRKTLVEGLVLLIVATCGKLIAAWFTGAPGLNRWVLGTGMVPRGEVGFVFAQIGLTGGLLDDAQFASLSLALIGTTVAGPILLRMGWKPS
ncbi:MAG: cation:proton antiporter [Deferrisomatales bacterium]